MSTKRRDNKGRGLLNGEIQKESGRYRYRYIDILGKRREIYSWRLTEADPAPAGRRRDKSLREKSHLDLYTFRTPFERKNEGKYEKK